MNKFLTGFLIGFPVGFGITYVFGSALLAGFGLAFLLLNVSAQSVLIGLSVVIGLALGVVGGVLAYAFSAISTNQRLAFAITALAVGLALTFIPGLDAIGPLLDAVGIIGFPLVYAVPAPGDEDGE